MNDDAVCLAHRVPLWEPSLLAMNDDAVCLTYRGACIAGKPLLPGSVTYPWVITVCIFLIRRLSLRLG